MSPLTFAVDRAIEGAGPRARTERVRRVGPGPQGVARRGARPAPPAVRTVVSAVRELLRCHPRPPLFRVLAADARRDLGDGPEAGRPDRLAAGLAHPVLAGPEAVERRREPIGPLDEETPHREGHLPVLADPP